MGMVAQSADNTVDSDKKLIDRIIYLASLASNPSVIDPILDTLRLITASTKAGEPLSAQDRQKLGDVERKLKDHLIHKDMVRSYTEESLRQQILEHFGDSTHAPKRLQSLREVIYLSLISIACFIFSLTLYPAPHKQRILMSPRFASASLALGVAWLFWSGLRNFNDKLKHAYRVICIGYVVTGFNAAATPLALMFPALSNTIMFRYGILFPIFLIANILIYLGTQLFAKTLNIKSIIASRWFVFLMFAVLGATVALLPHPTREPSELYFDVNIVSDLGMVIFAACSSWLAFKIARQVTSMYAKAMGWFSITMLSLALPFANTFRLIFLHGQLKGVGLMMMGLPFVLSTILMVVSAYTFKRSSGRS